MDMNDRPHGTRHALRGILVLALWGVLGIGAAAAQDKKPTILISHDPKKPSNLKELLLRPNVAQTVYFFIENPGEDAGKFTVRLLSGDGQTELARGEKSVAGGKTEPITLAPAEAKPPAAEKPAPDQKPAAPDQKPAPPKELPELKDPAKGLLLLLLDEKGTELEKRQMAVSVMRPQLYLTAKAEYDGAKRRLSVIVELVPANFSGPDCTVTLDLRPSRIPALITEGAETATLTGVLSPAAPKKELFVEGLQFQPGVPKKGLVYLTADGYPRAFLVEAHLDTPSGRPLGTPQQERAIRLLPAMDRFPLPPLPLHLFTPVVARYPINLEVDDPSSKATVDVVLDSEHLVRPGAREEHVFYNPAGPEGGFLFQTRVQDWHLDVNTAGVIGQHKLKVRLLESEEPKAEVNATLVFDKTPPLDVKIGPLPKFVPPGRELPVTATGIDKESDVKRVVFFLGKPNDKREIPPEAVKVEAQPPASQTAPWKATLEMPLDKKGPLDIGVMFVNGAGMTTFGTASVQVGEPPPVTAKDDSGGAAAKPAGPGKITGTVTEGPRTQSKLDVVLKDEKGMEKDKVKTDKAGNFVFEKVPPGKYTVSTSKESSQTKAQANVVVKADETVKVKLELLR
jgi:hypothetical protein